MTPYPTRLRFCHRHHRRINRILGAIAVILLLPGCSPTSTKPTDAVIRSVGAGTADNIPKPSAPRVPSSQQEAQDTVISYLQKTVDSLPRGTKLDATDFRGGANMSCEDEPMTDTPPTRFEYWTHVTADNGASTDDLITKTGDTWRSWGADVKERDDFRKPNRFGYLPDGYELQIKGAAKPGYPPTLIVTSPCFPGQVARRDIPSPRVIEQTSQGS